MKQFRETPYFVTEDGKCFRNEKQMKPYINSKGYLKIDVYVNGNKKSHYLHRMIAETFIVNPKNLPQINHINGDKTDNHIHNLEWCNSKQNMIHRADALGKCIDLTNPNTKIPAKEIQMLRWKKSIGYPINIREIAEKWGLRVDYLRKVINGNERKRV